MTIYQRWLLIGFFAILMPSIAGAAHRHVVTPHRAPEYSLIQTPISKDLFRLRFVQTRTGRVLWNGTTRHGANVAWSKDRRRLALVIRYQVSEDSEQRYKLVLWRAGSAVRTYANVAPLATLEGLWNLRWSPDGRRLLWLGARSQGSGSVGSGRLYVINVPIPARCLYDVNKGRESSVSPDCAAPITEKRIECAEWVGRRSIRYWTPALFNPRQTGVVHCS